MTTTTSSSRPLLKLKPGHGTPMSPVTRRLISMRPGKRIEIGYQANDLRAERGRMASRIRTAKLATGYRYRVVTEGGRLFVVCEEAS